MILKGAKQIPRIRISSQGGNLNRQIMYQILKELFLIHIREEYPLTDGVEVLLSLGMFCQVTLRDMEG